MRTLLRAALIARGTPGNWDHITNQIGMFSFTGLTEAQSIRMVSRGSPLACSALNFALCLRRYYYMSTVSSHTPLQVEDFHVYMLPNGRISVAGLSEATIDIAANAIHAVVTGSPVPAPAL